MRREQFQLLRLALFIEDLDRLQPARLRRTVQLAQIAQRSLTRTIRRAHRFHQRPIGVVLAVLAALVRPQKHSGPIVSSAMDGFKRVGLHYIAFQKIPIVNRRLAPSDIKIAEFGGSVTNFG